jgi:MYXO-CTERM domain-containing protein
MSRSRAIGAAAAAALVLAVPSAEAQIVPGSTLSFTGTADVIHTEEHDLFVRFAPTVISVAAPGTGSFAALGGASGTSGTIRDFEVVVGPQPIAGFVTLGGYTFDLMSMSPGLSAPDDCLVDPLPGQSCTPPRHDVEGVSTPFTLRNVASGDPSAPISSIAFFDVQGMVRGPGSTIASPFMGRFEASFIGQSYQEVLYYVETSGLQGVRFTAQLTATSTATSTVPEPSTYALAATGLAGLLAVAGVRRRRLAVARR